MRNVVLDRFSALLHVLYICMYVCGDVYVRFKAPQPAFVSFSRQLPVNLRHKVSDELKPTAVFGIRLVTSSLYTAAPVTPRRTGSGIAIGDSRPGWDTVVSGLTLQYQRMCTECSYFLSDISCTRSGISR